MPRLPRFDPVERCGLPQGALPRHLAIIMDGNGRWAQRRRRARIWGHRAGVASVRAVAVECARLGLERLTLYAFSQENWKRPEREVSILWKLLRSFLVRTAGEMRVSNFLLWQISYAEFHVTPVFWPEFREAHLHEALREYARRDRRFGALPAEAPAG